jgi:hypothetical protein
MRPEYAFAKAVRGKYTTDVTKVIEGLNEILGEPQAGWGASIGGEHSQSSNC